MCDVHSVVHDVVRGCYYLGVLNDRFWAKVKKTDTCWLWIGAPKTGRYGQVNRGGKPKLAHRLSYEDAHGPIPDGMQIHHTCRVTKCVNPAHLEAVTPKGNMAQARWALTETCPHGHPYDEANTYPRPDGGRGCRRCRADWVAALRARRKRAESCTCPCSCGARI